MTLRGLRPLKIIGCGGHGRVIADIARARGEHCDGFLSDWGETNALGLPVSGPIRAEIARFRETHRFIVGIGDAYTRRILAEEILLADIELATLVHPTAVIASDVSIDVGTVVMAGAIINVGSKIGRFAIVNTGTILDHDTLIEDNVGIAPGCTFAGHVTCRHDSLIGTGAAIINKITVGAGALVAAGSTVIRDVPPGVLVAGCPAVIKKKLAGG